MVSNMLMDNNHKFIRGKKETFRSCRGISLIEVVISMFLTAIGIMAIMSMQPSAWKTEARADYMGRAAMILSAELERQQAWIMNPCNSVTVNPATTTAVVRSSGMAASLEGDAVYTVTTTVTSIGTNIFTVIVTVAWNGGANTITGSTNVIRQELWRFPEGCPDA